MDEPFPLPGGIVRPLYCQGVSYLNNHPVPPIFVLQSHPPPVAWAEPLALGDVFIPLQGEAVLDRDAYATAELDSKPDASLGPSAKIKVKQRAPGSGTYSGKRVGESFVWGSSQAEIVRIIDWHPVTGGWVEVRLTRR
jgi:hypothetical protein